MSAPKPISPAELDRILALRAAGWTINSIARRVRRMNSAITDALKAAGRLALHGGGRRGVPRDPALAMKPCGDCGVDLPLLTEFYGNRTKPDGRADQCRECQKDRQRDRYGRLRDAMRCSDMPASNAEPSERTYLPHDWHHIGDPALRFEAEAQYLSLLEPPPLFFSDGRRMDA